jgi:hypothetical protein
MTRFNFTLSGYLDLDDPQRASEAAGIAVSLEDDGTTSRGPLDPSTALHALLISAVVGGLASRELGVYDVGWTTVSVTAD